MPKNVHRISDYAADILDRMAASSGVRPGPFLDQLVCDYAAGLTWARDEHGRPDLSDIPAPVDSPENWNFGTVKKKSA